MNFTETYRIILDELRLWAFIEWLPKLLPGEVFYGCLFARKKYDISNVVRTDKGQLKRFTATKEYLYQKIRQLECEAGSYKIGENSVPENTLALYIMPNPRSLLKATQKSLVELSQVLVNPNGRIVNPYKVALTQIQKSPSRKVFLDFDFDNKEFSWEYFEHVVNPECITVLKTRGGFHLLVELSKISERYSHTWYNEMVKVGCDVRGDNLIPVPGCTQGGFSPAFRGVR